MPTPLFRDLSPRAAADVVSAFLGKKSRVEFTEKLAGQNFTAARSDGVWRFSVKPGASSSGGIFPDVENALIEQHPDTGSDLVYRFEVLNTRRRPDFIDYELDRPTAVEFTGALTPAVASTLNSSQSDVAFLTKDDIKKPVGGLVSDPSTVEMLQKFVDKATGGRIDRAEMLEVESVLMDLVDRGKVPSSLGGGRIEGLFGSADGKGFKVPSKEYTEIQRRQAKFYAVVKANKSNAAVKRFIASVADPKSDRLVSDVLDYIDYVHAKPQKPGFRVFFSSEEVAQLRGLSDEYRAGNATAGATLARKFFTRVKNKDAWVATSSRNSQGIIRTNEAMSHGGTKTSNFLSLLREFIYFHKESLR